jgi:hypothetical protein
LKEKIRVNIHEASRQICEAVIGEELKALLSCNFKTKQQRNSKRDASKDFAVSKNQLSWKQEPTAQSVWHQNGKKLLKSAEFHRRRNI